MADFPNSVKNFLSLNDGVDRIIAAHPNDRGDEITAIETLLGALGSIQSNTESLKNLLININKNVHLEYKTAATLTLKAGEIAIPDASGNVRWRRNTSDLTIDWGDIDIGAEANDTYYVYAMADAAGTGFIVKISLSASLPFGGTFYRKIGSFENVSGDIKESSIINDDDSFSTQFESWVSKSNNVSYLASSDGFVLAMGSGNSDLKGYTDSSDPPTTLRQRCRNSVWNGSEYESFMMPVKKGHYWKVTGTSTVYWMPNE